METIYRSETSNNAAISTPQAEFRRQLTVLYTLHHTYGSARQTSFLRPVHSGLVGWALGWAVHLLLGLFLL